MYLKVMFNVKVKKNSNYLSVQNSFTCYLIFTLSKPSPFLLHPDDLACIFTGDETHR